MRAFVLWVLLGEVGCLPSPAIQSTRATVGVTSAITHVSVLLADGIELRDATVLIALDRIAAVGPSDSIAVPPGARRIDGRGKWLIPGLWDMHVHLTLEGRAALGLYVANGVTMVRDMGGQLQVIHQMRRDIADGRIAGPGIVAAGPQIESPKSIVSDLAGATATERARALLDRVVVSDPASAQRVVDSLAALGVDFIKVRNFADADTYWAIARAARRHNLSMVGHAPPFAMDWMAIADSGQRSLEHWYYPTALMDKPPAERRDIVAAYRRNGTAMAPTMMAWRAHRWPYDSVRVMTEQAIARGTAMGVLSSALAEHWRSEVAVRATEGGTGPLTEAQLGGWRRALDGLGRGIGELSRAGVIVLAGTDMPLARLPGEALHDEIALLVEEAGFTPAQAIGAATSVPAAFLHMQDSLGTIAPTKIANLVLLDGDPLKDIHNTRRIALVIVRGRVVDRSALTR